MAAAAAASPALGLSVSGEHEEDEDTGGDAADEDSAPNAPNTWMMPEEGRVRSARASLCRGKAYTQKRKIRVRADIIGHARINM